MGGSTSAFILSISSRLTDRTSSYSTGERRLFNATERHGDKALVLLAQLQEKAPESYEQFYAFQKEWLTSLIDHTRSLSHLLNQHVQM